MDVVQDGHEHPTGGGHGIVVTIADIYRVQQAMNSEIIKMGVMLQESISGSTVIQERITAHDETILTLKGDVVALQTRLEIAQQEKPPKANGVTLAAVGVAAISCVVAIITLIVSNIR